MTQLGESMNKVQNSVYDLVLGSFRNSVCDSAWNSVWNIVDTSIYDVTKPLIQGSVYDSIHSSVCNSVDHSVKSKYE